MFNIFVQPTSEVIGSFQTPELLVKGIYQPCSFEIVLPGECTFLLELSPAVHKVKPWGEGRYSYLLFSYLSSGNLVWGGSTKESCSLDAWYTCFMLLFFSSTNFIHSVISLSKCFFLGGGGGSL